MRHLKKLFYILACGLVAICIFVLVIALNPPMSEEIARILYGEDGAPAAGETPLPQETQTPLPEEEQTPLPTAEVAVMTPLPLYTQAPETEQEDLGAVYVVTSRRKSPSAYAYVGTGDYIIVPEEVSSLGGYTPVEMTKTAQETAAPAATAIPLPTATTAPEAGETALPTATPTPTPLPAATATPNPESGLIELEYDELYFDPLFYPYYHMLDSREQLLYNQLYANMLEGRVYVKPYAELPADVVKNVFEAVYNDHPELFYVETSFSCKTDSADRVVELTLKYNALAQNLTSALSSFALESGKILDEARTLADDYEKEKFVHDKLAEQVKYTAGASMSQSAYSALINKETVCAGYARAFQYLLQQLGIPCYYCTGYSGMNHAWNIVYLYGDYYNVDLTWDDTNPMTYDYFNRTDEDLRKNHRRSGLSVNLPACLGTIYRDVAEVEAEAGIWDEPTALERELQLYYNTCYQRIADNGLGKAAYEDVYSSDMWKQICQVYENGQISEAFFTRAFYTTGGSAMTMRVEGEQQENGTYKVTHTITIDG